MLDRSDVKTVLIDGEVILGPRNDLIILARRVFPLEETLTDLSSEECDLMRKIFQGKNLQEIEKVLDRIIAPQIRGRVMAKLAAALAAVSAKWFNVGSISFIPGCIRVLFFGDPRTGKGAILRWFWQHGIAGHAVGETASRTGLVYSIDSELNLLSWGIIPQNDGRMVVIEGLHGLSSEELSKFREILIQQRVEVHRKVSGAAWCRTRILADCNPEKGLKEYLHPCIALLDIKPFHNPIDLTRWDLFIPFFADDVPVKEMYGNVPEPSNEEIKAFKALIRWMWTRRAENIVIKEETYERAKLLFEELRAEYSCEDLPILHNGSIWSILRLAIGMAALQFNSPDGESLIIEPKHVEEAVNFLKSCLDRLELAEYKAIQGEHFLTEDEFDRIQAELQKDRAFGEILLELAKTGLDSDELAGKLGCSSVTVRRKITKLKELGLVKRGRKYNLTTKGIQFLKKQYRPTERLRDTNDTQLTPEAKKVEVKQIENTVSTVSGKNFKILGYYSESAICEVCGAIAFGFYKVKDKKGKILTICKSCRDEL